MTEAIITIGIGVFVMMHMIWVITCIVHLALQAADKHNKKINWLWMFDNDYAVGLWVIDAVAVVLFLSALIGGYIYKHL